MNNILISIGPFNIYYYSLCILAGVILAISISMKESKKHNMEEYIENLIYSTIILGIIGARLYYVMFNFGIYKNDLLGIMRIWEGGLAIYGGIIAGIINIIYHARRKKQSVLETMDIITPGLIIAQSIGRWGNFFNQEAHGSEVSLELLQSIHIPNFIINGMNINGIYYHPTFLYESVWCLIGFLILLKIRKEYRYNKGVVTYSYFIWYGIGRVYIEGLRTDSLYIGNFRVSQIISLIIIIIGIYGIIKKILKKHE